MKTKIFNRKVDFYHYLNSVSDKFDLKKSLMANEWSFVTSDGKHVNSIHFANFIKKLNTELGTTFDENASKQVPAGYVIVIKDPEDADKKESDEETEDQDVASTVVVDSAEPEGVVIQDNIDAILRQAQDLYQEGQKKESKDALASFALENDVVLDKRVTFENMMDDFKAALEQKKAQASQE